MSNWLQFKQKPRICEYPKYSNQLHPVLLGALSVLDKRINLNLSVTANLAEALRVPPPGF